MTEKREKSISVVGRDNEAELYIPELGEVTSAIFMFMFLLIILLVLFALLLLLLLMMLLLLLNTLLIGLLLRIFIFNCYDSVC